MDEVPRRAGRSTRWSVRCRHARPDRTPTPHEAPSVALARTPTRVGSSDPGELAEVTRGYTRSRCAPHISTPRRRSALRCFGAYADAGRKVRPRRAGRGYAGGVSVVGMPFHISTPRRRQRGSLRGLCRLETSEYIRLCNVSLRVHDSAERSAVTTRATRRSRRGTLRATQHQTSCDEVRCDSLLQLAEGHSGAVR